jgi:hypothetical protein
MLSVIGVHEECQCYVRKTRNGGGLAKACELSFYEGQLRIVQRWVVLEGLPHLQSSEPRHQSVPKSHRA